MPELPDLEGARRSVEQELSGARVTGVDRPDPDVLRNCSLRELRIAVVGHRITAVDRHGKWLMLDADGPSVLFHLGMTGRMNVVPLAEDGAGRSGAPARLALRTDRGDLRLVDRRRLGSVWLAHDAGERSALLADLGPDALGLRCPELLRTVRARRAGLKAVLMDQSALAGLGNMLSDEILWRARLHPAQRASELTDTQARRLCNATRTTLRAAVRAGHIPRTRGWLSGQRAADKPRCPRCSTNLRWSRINARAALWCPRCQPPADR